MYMAVKNKANRDIENFIDKGADVKNELALGFKNILVRVPAAMLQRIDEEVEKKPWATRTQWIVDALYERLTKGA